MEVYKTNGLILMHGDCADVLKILRTESVDAVVTDPSYGISYRSQRAQKGTSRDQLNRELMADRAVDSAWIAQAARVLRTGGALYMFTRWDVWSEWQAAIAQHLTIRNAIVWEKSNHTAGDLVGNYAYKYELILFATKGRHIPYWDHRETNIWKEPSLTSSEKREHPTQKPIGVTARCIVNAAPPGGIILDPFVGSGTTLVAAGLLGYRGIGIEIESQYIEVAKQRLVELE